MISEPILIEKAEIKTKLTLDQIDSLIVDLSDPTIEPDELKLRYPKLIVVILNDGIYDMTTYNHPGSNRLLRKSNFKDVGRYLFGISGLEHNNSEAHTHSGMAFKALQDRRIGTLSSQMVKKTLEFTLEAKLEFSKTTSMFVFKNPDFSHKLFDGTAWMGKHYQITIKDKTRLYTNCITLAEDLKEHREGIIRAAQRLLGTQPNRTEDIESISNFAKGVKVAGILPLVIKNYGAETGVSTHVHDLRIGQKVVISGPFGRGFSLKHDAQGHVLIVAGGTGILPFLDLLDYLLKKALAMSLQKAGKDASWIQPQQNYNDHFG